MLAGSFPQDNGGERKGGSGAATEKCSQKPREGPGLRAGEVPKFLILYPAVTLFILVSQWENTCFSS